MKTALEPKLTVTEGALKLRLVAICGLTPVRYGNLILVDGDAGGGCRPQYKPGTCWYPGLSAREVPLGVTVRARPPSEPALNDGD